MRLQRLVRQCVQLARGCILPDLAIPFIRVEPGVPSTEICKLSRRKPGNMILELLNVTHSSSLAEARYWTALNVAPGDGKRRLIWMLPKTMPT